MMNISLKNVQAGYKSNQSIDLIDDMCDFIQGTGCWCKHKTIVYIIIIRTMLFFGGWVKS